ncbi:MAG: hypothetical protein LBG84_05580 [Treponema sp.]|jgi:beta-galactosidase/evolved beta-galactosidase subunit alpha|nr:hypothetical protein [Treponema sp.]
MRFSWDNPKPDWCNLELLERDRAKPRSLVLACPDADAARAGNPGGRCISLNGLWRFAFYDSPVESGDAFMREDFDDRHWDQIAVPSEWEFSGYGRPHYTDVLAVFPASETPFPPEYNPTGCYRRAFDLPEDELLTIIRFEGVESAFHLWVNGVPAGYSQGSRLVSEFDISSLVRPGKNVLAVRVYKFSDGCYLENQDMWYLAGIFRDVSLIRRPVSHIADIRIKAAFLPDGAGRLDIVVDCAGPVKGLGLVLELEREGRVLWQAETAAMESCSLTTELAGVAPWSAESPALYNLTVSLRFSGGCLEAAALRTGFRTIEISDGLLRINGAALKFRGVNYHLWLDTQGRKSDAGLIRRDLETLKTHNVNAIRTSHYPQPSVFYDMCDEMGFYVIGETDLECCMCQLFDEPNLYASSPRWEAAFLDRVRRAVIQEYNHPSVVIWSLGNESGYGPNFAAAAALARELDDSRPVHYEEDRHAESADVFSTMYTHHDKLKELGEQCLPKPHIVCEYGHSMGNGPGGLEEYWDIFWAFPRLQGGFLWEWRDHSIRMKGSGQVCYGGDFGDMPNNGDFCADGLTLGDGTLSPAMAEVKHVLSPIRAVELDKTASRVCVWNRNDFSAADIYVMVWEYAAAGKILKSGRIILPDIKPGEKGWVALHSPLETSKPDTVTLRFFRRNETPELEIDACQFFLPENEERRFSASRLPLGETIIEEKENRVLLKCGESLLEFSKVYGRPELYSVNGTALLNGPMEMCFYRAPLQNDIKQSPVWEKFMVPYIQPCLLEMETKSTKDAVEIRIQKRYAPYTMNWFIDAELIYRMLRDGSFILTVKGECSGRLPPTIPRIGLYGSMPGSMDYVRWYGRGPGECYRDSKTGSLLGVYESTVEALHFPYAVPQENGNRTDARYVSFYSAGGMGLLVEAAETLNFTAHHYTLEDCIKAKHETELKRREDIWFHLDQAHHGLGSASCGPDALPRHSLTPGPFAWEWHFVPLVPAS